MVGLGESLSGLGELAGRGGHIAMLQVGEAGPSCAVADGERLFGGQAGDDQAADTEHQHHPAHTEQEPHPLAYPHVLGAHSENEQGRQRAAADEGRQAYEHMHLESREHLDRAEGGEGSCPAVIASAGTGERRQGDAR